MPAVIAGAWSSYPLKIVSVVKDSVGTQRCKSSLGQARASAKIGVARIRMHDEYANVRIGIGVRLP